jgi:hypothetical protein
MIPGKAGQHRLCWVSQTRAKQRACIEQLKDDERADIPLVTRPPMHDLNEPHEPGRGMSADSTGTTLRKAWGFPSPHPILYIGRKSS